MGTIDDLRTAQGAVAVAVADVGAKALAAADRITNAIAALQAQVQEGTLNDATIADVAALAQTESDLRGIGEAIAALGADPSTEIPEVPAEEPPAEPPAEEPPAEEAPTEG